VSASSHYDWCAKVAAGPTASEWDEAILVNEMYGVHRHLDDTYGSPRMTDELRRRGYCVNHKRTERLMAQNGLYAQDGRRKKLRTTIPDVSAPPLPDLIQRNFSVGAPSERTCGDITYVPTTEGWLYVADVEDIGSRRIVGFAMAEHMRTELVASALEMAVAARGGLVEGMTFHHDRGAQYLSREFRTLCERHGIAQSIGRTGSCLLTGQYPVGSSSRPVDAVDTGDEHLGRSTAFPSCSRQAHHGLLVSHGHRTACRTRRRSVAAPRRVHV
jgi:putative transposase